MKHRFNWPGTAVIVTALALVQIAAMVGLLVGSYIPAPVAVLQAGLDLIMDGTALDAILHTLSAALGGWGLAGIAGIGIGTLIALFPVIGTFSLTSFDVLRALPVVAFVPVAVLLLGYTLSMEVAIAFFGAVWPILLSTTGAFKTITARQHDLCDTLTMPTGVRLWKVYWPASVPQIVVGLRLGLATALVLAIVAEMIGNPAGIGYAIIQSTQALQTADSFAFIVMTGFLGLILNSTLMLGARTVFRGPMLAAQEVR